MSARQGVRAGERKNRKEGMRGGEVGGGTGRGADAAGQQRLAACAHSSNTTSLGIAGPRSLATSEREQTPASTKVKPASIGSLLQRSGGGWPHALSRTCSGCRQLARFKNDVRLVCAVACMHQMWVCRPRLFHRLLTLCPPALGQLAALAHAS